MKARNRNNRTTSPYIRGLFTALAVLLLFAGCGGKTKGVIPRDYSQHGRIIRMNPAIFTDSEVGWTRVDDATMRRVYFSDRLTLELTKTEKADLKKNIRTEHSYHDRIGYILQGGAIVTVAKDTRQIGPGGAFVVPSNVPFDVIPASDNTVILYAYTPPRNDLRPPKPVGLKFSGNDIRSFVYRWFGLFDDRADASEFEPLLSSDSCRMEFADKTTVTSWRGFAKAYAAWLRSFSSGVHKVEQLNVQMDPVKGRYLVEVVYTWDGADQKTGKPVQGRYQGDWVLEDYKGGDLPWITSYVEKALAPKGGAGK